MLWLSVVVDNACTRILDVQASGGEAMNLRVSPTVYNAVAEARGGEVARHYPLMLLGLPLIADRKVETYDPVVGS
jgi:hypothetical protein